MSVKERVSAFGLDIGKKVLNVTPRHVLLILRRHCLLASLKVQWIKKCHHVRYIKRMILERCRKIEGLEN